MSKKTIPINQPTQVIANRLWKAITLDDALAMKDRAGTGWYVWIAVDAVGEALTVSHAGNMSDIFKAKRKDLNQADWFSRIHRILITKIPYDSLERERVKRQISALYKPDYYRIGRYRSHRSPRLPRLSEGLYLYKYTRQDGSPVYVGVTKDLTLRRAAHKTQHWYEPGLRLHIKLFNVRQNALNEEQRQIESIRPIGNRMHNPDYMSSTS